ncbi:MAG: hypothetical protein HYZ12_03935 [Thaumarchaeota archaeon]|nr:hypothetical protein [Nitrososphaerota archaeon]
MPFEEAEEPLSWQQALAEDPAYYMDTEAGRQELAAMIRKESERLIEELGKSVKRTREIIWLSRWCKECKFFEQNGSKIHCRRWDVRIVKPFYGKAVWSKVPARHREDEKELVVSDIDWNKKWKEISDTIVEWAVDKVNGGVPYFCFTSQ